VSEPSVRRPFRPAAHLRWTIVTIVVLAMLAATLTFAAYGQETDARVEEARLLARAAALDVDRYLQSQLGTLMGIAAADPVADEQADAMREYFDRLNPSAIGFDGQVFWVDVDGMMRARAGYDGPPLDFSDREWVQQVLASNEPYVSNARIGQLNDAPILVLAVPTVDRDGAPSGALGGAIRLDRASVGAFSFRTAAGTPVRITDRIGQFVAGPEPIRELVTVDPAFPLAELQNDTEGVIRRGIGPAGEVDRLLGFATVPTGDWLVIVDQAEAAVLGPARERLAAQLALTSLITLLAGLTALLAMRRVSASLRRQQAAYAAESQARAQLERAVAELQEREEVREAFVGVLSHELRTPVTTIYGMANLLVRTPDRPDRAAIGEDIREESDRLYRIVEDLLVLSRAERGALSIAPEPVLVQRLIPAIAADLGRRFPNVPFAFDIPDEMPPVAGEEGPLRQVLGNLLTNAAKYGGGTPVRLTARQRGERAEFVVEDGGSGIDPDDADRLFELFYRSPRTARKAAGTGIGLYVVRQLVEAMGGRVHAGRSAAGGAAFTVEVGVYARRLDQGVDADRPGADQPARRVGHAAAAARPPATPGGPEGMAPSQPNAPRTT
jgi:signal transduction histidine kinase